MTLGLIWVFAGRRRLFDGFFYETYSMVHALKFSDVVFILLMIVKMPTNVAILTFMIKVNFMLN